VIQFAIVADDLTGAADAGACFVPAGLGLVILLSDNRSQTRMLSCSRLAAAT